MNQKQKKTFVRVMCVILALLMAGSVFLTVIYSCA